MASRIRQLSIASGGWTPVSVAVSCAEAQLRIPTDAGSAVDIREDPAQATWQDTLQPGESYRTQTTPRGHRLIEDTVFVYAQAQSGTVTGIVLGYDK